MFDDYYNENLTDYFDTPMMVNLTSIVDPYSKNRSLIYIKQITGLVDPYKARF